MFFKKRSNSWRILVENPWLWAVRNTWSDSTIVKAHIVTPCTGPGMGPKLMWFAKLLSDDGREKVVRVKDLHDISQINGSWTLEALACSHKEEVTIFFAPKRKNLLPILREQYRVHQLRTVANFVATQQTPS